MFKWLTRILKSARKNFSNSLYDSFSTPFVVRATYNENDRILTVEYSDKKIFNYYDGRNHIWNELPNMKKCSNSKCWELSQIKAYIDSYSNFNLDKNDN